MRRALPLLLVLAATACGSSSQQADTTVASAVSRQPAAATVTPAEKPDDFLRRLLAYDFKGQWSRSWAILHPGQRRYVSRAEFTACSVASFPNVELVSAKTIEIHDDVLSLADVPEKRSKAVTITLTVRSGKATDATTKTFHAVLHAGKWAWILPAADAQAYKAGTCPA